MKKVDVNKLREFKLGRRDDNVDMLNTPLFSSIAVYAIPIILSQFLQLFFNAADLVVVGRFCGDNSLAAVGSTNSVSQLIVNLFSGLAVGVSVRVSNGFGENSWIKVNKAVHTCIPIALIGGCLVAVVGYYCSRPMLVAMDTPAEILDLAVTYLKIYFLGIPFNLVFNYGAAVLRADGDTKNPLLFLTISGILNIILNVVFVVFFKLDVAGVALATSLTTGLAAVLVVIELMRKTDASRLQIKYIKIDKKATLEIFRYGIPAGISQSMFSISNVIIQSSLNGFGKTVVAGSSAAQSLLGFGYAVLTGFSQAAVNFAGQNYGAKKYDRVYKIKNVCLFYEGVVGFIVYFLIWYFGTPLLSIYIKDNPLAIDAGLVRLAIVGLTTFINGLFDIMCSLLRGMKYSILPTSINIIGICGVRLLIMFTIFRIPKFNTLEVLYSTYPISWLVSLIAVTIAFRIIAKKKLPRLPRV